MTLLALLLASALAASPGPERRGPGVRGPHSAAPAQVAVTIDDLPGPPGSVVGGDLAALQEMTLKLLMALKASGTPAIGFVNEGKLAPDGEREASRVALLEAWLEAGMDLGNHTYSHRSLNRIPLDEFEKDTVRGEETTKALLAKRGKTLRYFRHPFLHTGRSLEVKRGFETFVRGRGYEIAPVTHDNGEWIFALAYAKAGNAGDAAAQKRILDAYVPYMETKFDYWERTSRALFGREIPQILLIHANSLNADAYPELARMMKSRGYQFVSLDQALEDAAFRSADTFTGAGGISWLHRWTLTEGKKPLPDEPVVPKFVLEAARVDSE